MAYLPALRGGFVWDDDTSLTQNPFLKSASGLHQLWFSTSPADYWPVTETAFWIEWHAWGLNPLGYHAINLVLHVTGALLLWVILQRLRIAGSWLGALLFAVHPVNVESVAWITQLKNQLALVFYFASILAFLHIGLAAPRPERGSLNRRDQLGREWWLWYILSIGLFVLAMLSKGSVAFLPLVLVGLILWRRRVDRRDLLFLAPFFAIAAGLAWVDVWFQGHHVLAADAIRHAGFPERLLGAAAAVWFYLGKAVLPVDLIFIYPRWRIDPASILWYLPLAATLGLTVLLWRKARPIFFGWLYFCAALIPVMGFTDVYFMNFSLVADHYQHLALVGITALAGFGWSCWRRKTKAADCVAAALVCAGAALTWRQARTYHDAITLYRTTIERNPNSALACYNLGTVLVQAGRPLEAIRYFEQGLSLVSGSAEHLNLGVALRLVGRKREALAHFEAAVKLRPGYAEAHYNAGVVLADLGQMPEAIVQYREAVRLRPDYVAAHNNLGMVLRDTGHLVEAVAEFRRALQLEPNSAEIHNNLGIALADEGNWPAATEKFRQATTLRPDYSEAYTNLANLLRMAGDVAGARRNYLRALALNPAYAESHYDFAMLLVAGGQVPEAIIQLREALRLKPDYPEALDNLGNALQAVGKFGEAIECYARALQLRPNYPQARSNLAHSLQALGRTQ